MDEASGSKTKAADLVGLPSYQTFSNRLQRYGLAGDTKSAVGSKTEEHR
ncbi:MAG: hypothetical protein HYV63_05210 [Candidatus Schekmanbacteria bacterium]|nr:hypothetical protein [Candidatus Schekmanbacteria bacterium]